MDNKKEVTTTDTGWAWVVAIGVSVSFMITAGFVRGFGVFYAALVDEFGSSASVTSLIQGFRFCALCISAPIISGLTERFTERAVLFFGAAIFSLGLILSYFAPNLEFNVLTLGAMTGVGMAAILTPGQIAVGKYFDKYRSLANSICFCGSSLGMMSLPPLVMYLIHEYGLQGSFLIYGGLLLNCAVGAAVVRPFKGAYSKAAGLESIETGKSKRACTEAPSAVQKFQAAGKSEDISEYQSLFKDKKCRSPDIPHLPNSLPESSMLSAEVYEQKLSNTQTNSNNAIDDEQMFERAHSSSAQTRHTSMPSSSKMAKEWLQSKRQPNRNINTVTNSLEEPDFENSHRRWCSSYASLHCVDGSMYLFTDRECPMAEDLSFQRGPESLSSTKPSICDFIRSIFDFSLFRHVRFMLFLFSTSFAMVSFANVTIYLIPRAEEYGISRDKAALFLTIAGGCDIIGRLILGVVSDVKKIGPHRVMMVGLLVMGIATLLLPLAVTFNTMTVYVVLFGLIGSSGHLLCLPVVMMFVGGERMPRAMGLVMSFHGIASALSPPILGFIKDQTGTYDSTLYVCGACQLIASGLMMLEPLVGWIRSRYKS